MVAYLIADVTVTDAKKYEQYRALAPAAIAAHGGKYLARGGETASLEGGWNPGRVVILEFPSLAAAKRFYDSPEYSAARKMREGAAIGRFIAVEGVP